MTTCTCAFCNRAFEEDRGQPTCQGCPLARGCHFLRCPHCGYENPATPAWLRRVQGALRRLVAVEETA